MKKFLITAAIVLSCAVSIVPRASGQAAGFFSYTGVPTTAIPVGSSFTVTLTLNVSGMTGVSNVGAPGVNDLSGFSYWMYQIGAVAGSPNFQITNRTPLGLWTDLQSPPSYPQILDPINRNANGTTNLTDLGALILNGTAGQPNGAYMIATITFQALTPGTFTISNTQPGVPPGVGGRFSVFNDADGDTMNIAASTFNVTVIPEPSTYALLAFAGLGMIVVAYRRRAAAV